MIHPAQGGMRCRALFPVLVILIGASVGAGSDAAESTAAGLYRSFRVARSPGGRFLVSSTNARYNMQIGSWAEETASKAEKALGVDLSTGGECDVFIVLRGPQARETQTGGGKGAEGMPEGRILRTISFENGKFIQRLILNGYPEVDGRKAQAALCRVLLEAKIAGMRLRKGLKAGPGGPQGSRIPFWLWYGLAEDLYPALRARNGHRVYRMWREGLVPTAAEILASGGSDAGEAVCGVFFGWLKSLPDKRGFFTGMIERIADRQEITAGIALSYIGRYDKILEMEDGWDEWILSQRRMVYRLGSITPLGIEQFKTELRLRPGEGGVPLAEDPGRFIAFGDLAGLRDAEWIDSALKSKSITLRLLAVGRGKEFAAVVEKYCAFLQAVRNGRREDVLRDLLSEAEKALEELEDKVRGEMAEDGGRMTDDR
ncbi:MAG: hypothetical protein R6V03_10960 [Kiritimatiellia bacterium]